MAKKQDTTDIRDITQIRRANLRVLIEQWGGPSNLAKKLHLSGPSYISQLISDNRPFTEKTARKYEAALDLPNGWFDQERTDRPKPVVVNDRLMVKAAMLLGAALDEEKVQVSAMKLADLVIMVYEEASRTGSLDEDFVKRLVKLMK